MELDRIRTLATAIRNVSDIPAVKSMAEEILMQVDMLRPVKMEEARLPCPCGRKNLRKVLKYEHFKHYWRYVCPNCGRESEWVDRESRLKTAWNKMLREEEHSEEDHIPIPEFVQEILERKIKEFVGRDTDGP